MDSGPSDPLPNQKQDSDEKSGQRSSQPRDVITHVTRSKVSMCLYKQPSLALSHSIPSPARFNPTRNSQASDRKKTTSRHVQRHVRTRRHSMPLLDVRRGGHVVFPVAAPPAPLDHPQPRPASRDRRVRLGEAAVPLPGRLAQRHQQQRGQQLLQLAELVPERRDAVGTELVPEEHQQRVAAEKRRGLLSLQSARRGCSRVGRVRNESGEASLQYRRFAGKALSFQALKPALCPFSGLVIKRVDDYVPSDKYSINICLGLNI